MINIYVANKENWGGTFQYTELVINALNNRRKNTIIYHTEKIWKNKKNNRTIEIKKNIFSTFFIYFIILLNLSKLLNIKLLQKLTALPESFFEKNSTWIFPSQDIISCLCRGKKIASIHDLMHRLNSFPEISGFFRKKIRDFKFKKIINSANIILVDSKVGKKHVMSLFNHKKDNVRILAFFPIIRKFKKSNNLIFKKKYLCYPAQFWPHKNHKNLILAISKIAKIDKTIKLYLVGHKIRLYKKLKSLSIKFECEKNVIFFGYVDSGFVSNLYLNARALVMPSFLGPTNIPPIEAFLHRCPVLLSDVYAAKEQCGDSALYFNPNSVESIYRKISKVWFDNKTYLKLKKKSTIKSKSYSIKNFSKKLISFIDEA
jgi:glycosyltransferase involved in cell wall biosynthesis